MQRIRLKSSLLDWVLYLGDRQILDVGFRTGKLYRYFGVPQARYQELLRAESAGRLFNATIRNHYAYRDLSRSSAPVVLAKLP